MKNLKPRGVTQRLITSGVLNQTLLNSLGIFLNVYYVDILGTINTTSNITITITFIDDIAKALFDGFEISIDSTDITIIRVDNPDGSITINISYNPITLDDVFGNVHIFINSPELPVFSVPLHIVSTGKGIFSSAEVVNFGTATVGVSTLGHLSITNSSTVAPLVVTGYKLSNIYGYDFMILPSNFPLQLDPLGSYDLPILFVPNANDLRTMTLKFIDDDGDIPNVEVALIGWGEFEGVTLETTADVFADTGINLNVTTTGLFGSGLFYQNYTNDSPKAFLIMGHDYISNCSNLVFPDLLNGTLLSSNESISIPIRYYNANGDVIPRITLSGFYI